MREIVLDTETTGLDPRSDRIIEIGCVELFNRLPTGTVFHTYLNPKRDIAEEAFSIHGLSPEFLADKPLFADIAESFSAFISDSALVIHNAAFDMGFLNAEFDRIGFGKLPPGRATDTLLIARRKFPGGQNSLDGLCRRFNVDNSDRQLHGALKDANLLAAVYLELTGGAQSGLALEPGSRVAPGQAGGSKSASRAPRPNLLPPRLTGVERAAHEAFVAGLSGKVIWKN